MGRHSLPALQLLISSLPKVLNLEKGVGVQTAHAELTEAFERYLDWVEPVAKRKPAGRKRAR